MALNEREQKMAWVVGGVLGAAIIYLGVQYFYLSPKEDLQHKINLAIAKREKENNILYTGDKAIKEWADLRIPQDQSSAEALTREVVYAAAQANGFTINDWKSTGSHAITKSKEFSAVAADFEEASYTITAIVTTARLGHFLNQFESQKIPVRIEGVQIQARKPGQDLLTAEFSIKALVYARKVTKESPLLLPTVASGTEAPTVIAGTVTPANPNANYTAGGPQAAGGPAVNYNILNATLGSLDPGLPPGPTLEEQMKARRQYQLEGKLLPKPRFGDEPLAAGMSVADAMAARRKLQEEQLQAAEKVAATQAPKEPAITLKPGQTMEEAMAERRKQLEAEANAETAPATSPGGVR